MMMKMVLAILMCANLAHATVEDPIEFFTYLAEAGDRNAAFLSAIADKGRLDANSINELAQTHGVRFLEVNFIDGGERRHAFIYSVTPVGPSKLRVRWLLDGKTWSNPATEASLEIVDGEIKYDKDDAMWTIDTIADKNTKEALGRTRDVATMLEQVLHGEEHFLFRFSEAASRILRKPKI